MVAESPSLVLGGSRVIASIRDVGKANCPRARAPRQRISLRTSGDSRSMARKKAEGCVKRDGGRDGKALCELQGDPSQRIFGREWDQFRTRA
jgi:hypothetical protein